jgi:hypothetical protein
MGAVDPEPLSVSRTFVGFQNLCRFDVFGRQPVGYYGRVTESSRSRCANISTC